ncbi:putative amidoligase enzyme-domain-containing protein [Xylaria venustula]|nr:putative amidoligase enzyme-domain-containing protein [Xylaria venustula]
MGVDDFEGRFSYARRGAVSDGPPPFSEDHGSETAEESGDEEGNSDDSPANGSNAWMDDSDVTLSDDSFEDETPGQGTFGVELEFLVVQCPKVKKEEDDREVALVLNDPHPKDGRWISNQMARWELNDIKGAIYHGRKDLLFTNRGGSISFPKNATGDQLRDRYSRAKLTRILRERGLVVIKWPEPNINAAERHSDFVPINDFNESDESDDEREEDFANASELGDFNSSYIWHPGKNLQDNIEACLVQWQSDFQAYHASKNLKIYRTRPADIDNVVDNQCTVIPRRTPQRLEHLQSLMKERLTAQLLEAKQAREDERNQQVDPLHVPVPGLSQQYKAWTVTIDFSVDGNGMTKERYANAASEDPFDEYYWFGAEVVSPVLPMGDERSREAVRVACGALRDSLRCHKPMHVSTGLHVHMGNTKGWTLFQAKRFATFWFLAERTILKLHRVDRDRDRKWCAKIGGGSRLWRALFSRERRRREALADALPRNITTRKRIEREFQMLEHVPAGVYIKAAERRVLHYIWQYGTLTTLDYALGENETGPGAKSPGTIEARIMHGTLDADNINNWVRLLERIVHVVRDYSARDFQKVLDQFVRNRTLDQLLDVLGVSDDLKAYWRDPKRRDSEDRYWEYPDKDKVDWNEPFMVRGHKATHGAFWD